MSDKFRIKIIGQLADEVASRRAFLAAKVIDIKQHAEVMARLKRRR